MEKRNPIESNAAEAYIKSIKEMEDTEGSKKDESGKRLRREIKALVIENPLRWKEDRVVYPKSCRRLGAEYQVVSLPPVQSIDIMDMESSM